MVTGAGIAKVAEQLTFAGIRLTSQRLQNSRSMVTGAGIAKVAEQLSLIEDVAMA